MRHSRTVTVFLAVTPALAAGFALGRLSAPKAEAPAANPLSPCKVTRVVDGDTIRVLYRGRDESVRLLRINTPERGKPGFEEAKEAMSRLLGGRPDGTPFTAMVYDTQKAVLEFETPGIEERDRYGRLLAYVFVGSMNVNVEMVRLGHSRFWTEYGRGRYARDFEAAEREARRFRRLAGGGIMKPAGRGGPEREGTRCTGTACRAPTASAGQAPLRGA